MKLTVNQMKELIPDDNIKQAFLEREDVSNLSPEEQESEWEKALVNINKFRDLLTGLDSYIIGE